MSRLRENDIVFPSHAAILRQQMAKGFVEQSAHVDVAPDTRSAVSRALEGPHPQQDDCRIVFDQDESLIYI